MTGPRALEAPPPTLVEPRRGLARFLELLTRANCRPRLTGDRGDARCPCHDDRHASLSFGVGNRVPVVAKCQAGSCGADLPAILERLSASPEDRDLILGGARREPRASAIPLERTYLYRDEDGRELFRVVRRGRKFYQQRRAGDAWVGNLRGVRRVPYRLPEALEAIRRGATLYLTEGEKNVEDLVALGFAATCNPGGAGKWRDSFTALLREAVAVRVLADNDGPGRRHAGQVAASFHAAGVRDLRVVEFRDQFKPDGSSGGDVSDWLAQRVSLPHDARAEALHRLIESAPIWEPQPEASAPTSRPAVVVTAQDEKPNPTDLGNAVRLAARFSDRLRYCHPWNHWLVWDGRRWARDRTGEAFRLAKEVVRGLYAEASEAPDETTRKNLAQHAVRSEAQRRIVGMLELAKSDPRIAVVPEQFDRERYLLNLENGTFDLRTCELKPHAHADFNTRLAPVRYDPQAKHETWERFLTDMLPDPDLRTFVQRAAGYSLSGDTREEVLFFIHGPTCAGKSTFTQALAGVLGDYAVTADFESFVRRRSDSGVRNDIARLAGARMVLSLEVDEGRRLAEALVKNLTGRDNITARFLHQEFFEFTPAFKLWLVANHKPRANAEDSALWRRILLLPFTVSLPREKRDPRVKETLLEDPQARAAILAWTVQGFRAWQAAGLCPPPIVQRATQDYREECDHVAAFVVECCEPDVTAQVQVPELRARYETWCRENGERPVSAKPLAKALEDRGFVRGKSGSVRLWKGLRLE